MNRREFIKLAGAAGVGGFLGIGCVDPAFDFAGIVLASQVAGKEKTMGPRMHLLEIVRKQS